MTTTKKTTSKTKAPQTTKGQYRGGPEVTPRGITPLGNQPAPGKLSNLSDTPFDSVARGFLMGHMTLTTVSTFIGAWYVWGDDWTLDIAHFYWPMGFASVAAVGLVHFYFKRE